VSGASGGVIIGYPVGVIIGLVIITKVFHLSRIPFVGVLGIVIGMAITLDYGINPDDKDVYYLITCFILAPLILGTLGYSLKEERG